MCGPFHGKTRQQHDAVRRLVTKKLLLLMPHAVTGWFCEKEVSAVLLCLTGCTRLGSVPALRPVDSGRVPSYRCDWLVLQEEGVGRFVVLFFTCAEKSCWPLFVQECFRHTL